VARHVALFNQRDWVGLRVLLAEDVKLHRSLHPPRVAAPMLVYSSYRSMAYGSLSSLA
jgi:hypothetical protein